MKKILAAVILLSVLLPLSACGAMENPPPTPTPEQNTAKKALAAMSTDEKIGQLFVIRPESLEPGLIPTEVNNAAQCGVTEVSDAMAGMLKEYPAGGIVMFSKNISSPSQLKSFVAALQNASATPLILGIDEEGGSVARIGNFEGFDVPKFGSMGKVGATGDTANAGDVGYTIGSYLKEYGFTLDFAPVADVNTNPDNIVIGNRAFGSDPALVAGMVSAEIDGLHRAGVMSCAKHFPGHGDTKGDTHDGYVSVTKTWDELKSCELIPFVAAIEAGTDMIMAAHITAVNVTDDGLPASLSKELLTDKLRGELGYNGVVITDSMAMGAIANKYSSADAAVKSILAGADIVLMPQDYKSAFEGVRKAVEDGIISRERLDESVLRILNLKQRYGIMK